MIPIGFEESNVELQRPPNMTDKECRALPVFTDGKQCISKWRMSWVMFV